MHDNIVLVDIQRLRDDEVYFDYMLGKSAYYWAIGDAYNANKIATCIKQVIQEEMAEEENDTN